MTLFVKLALLCAFCAITMAQDSMMEDSKKYIKQCMEETKAMKKDFEDFGAQKLRPADVPDSLKCMMKCFMEKMGYFDAGTVNFNAKVFSTKLSAVAKPEDLQIAVNACKDLKGANPCDTGFMIMSCLWKNKMMQSSWGFLTGNTSA